MTSKPAAMPIFGDAYLADTGHLSTEEHGAYFLLLLAAWRTDDCALPHDDRKLARIAKVSPHKWRAMRDTIMEFWTLSDGRWTQKRQLKERAYVEERSRAARDAAEARWADNERKPGRSRGGARESFSQKGPKIREQKGAKIPDAPSDKQPIEITQSERCGRICGRICRGLCETDAPPPPPHNTEEEEEEARAREFNFREGAVARIVAAWNAMAATAGLAPVVGISPSQTENTLARLRDHGEAAILEAIAKVPRTRFLIGGGDKGWRLNFAHLVKPDTVRKIHAGEYFARARDGLSDATLDPDLELENPFALRRGE